MKPFSFFFLNGNPTHQKQHNSHTTMAQKLQEHPQRQDDLPALVNTDIVVAYREMVPVLDTSQAQKFDDQRWLEALGKDRIHIADKLQKNLREKEKVTLLVHEYTCFNTSINKANKNYFIYQKLLLDIMQLDL